MINFRKKMSVLSTFLIYHTHTHKEHRSLRQIITDTEKYSSFLVYCKLSVLQRRIK